MVLILKGNSEMGALVRSNLWYSICLEHLISSRVVTNRIFLSGNTRFLHACEPWSKLPSYKGSMQLPIQSPKVMKSKVSKCLVLIFYGNSEHNTHAWRKTGLRYITMLLIYGFKIKNHCPWGKTASPYLNWWIICRLDTLKK